MLPLVPMRFFAAALIFFGVAASYAQTPVVPHKMSFAGMTLTIRDDARREIQADVDALTKSPKHFNIKVERAKTYFPIIERIFAEEGLPDEFKYLVMQESALIPDAVSVSNAVGFWQFKDFTAVEMGLRVDKEIDERMNIVSATRAAARYLKKSNAIFDNWIYALQSYQMGAGGVRRSVSEKHYGARHMEINSKTYWYVKKYLAHKVAFENATQGSPLIAVSEAIVQESTSLKALAKRFEAEEQQLADYNKWMLKGRIPGDKKYTLVVPVFLKEGETRPAVAMTTQRPTASPQKIASAQALHRINGIPTIIAQKGERLSALAKRANVELTNLMKWNDVEIDHNVVAGMHYFLGAKKTKAEKAFHQAKPGDNLWLVSQQYGVQIKRLRKYNRLRRNQNSFTEQQVWLSSRKPKTMKAPQGSEVVELEVGAPIAWAATTSAGHNVAEIITAPSPVATEHTSNNDNTNTVNDSASVSTREEKTPLPEVSEQSTAQETIPLSQSFENTAAALDQPVGTSAHTVQPGETLYALAKRYGVTVMELAEWNNLNMNEGLRIGQVIRLRAVAEATDVTTEPKAEFHEVKSSDTLYGVAKQYGVTIKDLMDWNGKKDFSLQVGERLRVVRE